MPAVEDTWYQLWRERQLPVNVDPFDSKLDDELERTRLRRIFTQGLDATVGYVLPLRRDEAAEGRPAAWRGGTWHLRDGRLYLVPGDSPLGWRLPLDSLPWVPLADRPQPQPRDPSVALPELPEATPPATAYDAHQVGHGFAEGGSVSLQEQPLPAAAGAEVAAGGKAAAAEVTRTALCVEVRDPQRSNGPKAERAQGGKSSVLYVFMPPLERVEDYLELVAAIEATAAERGVKVVLEGYPPPRDPRLKLLQVTPDPGVIEVNIHPAQSWQQLVDHTEFLYATAREERLTSEKFMLDGRHTGTGGGNHFVLGGATPADSPFLRRADLLPSLLTYWHNHPSLSYLFSGLFIGPTSQAPRIDEARNDQVYELEIALAEIDRQIALHGEGGTVPPWLIDRTLRNLLIDSSGNTHRSEFCIDKLYSPDGATGRLGLLELRAFEMPPHARMSLAQQLLLRALVAWFWRQPHRGRGRNRLTRWGTELHDRFMLPSVLRADFDDVIADLVGAGYGLDAGWFAPHFEFRFPVIGSVAARGIELVLRSALEPWHVMGEEGAAGATVRYVDSSVERIEVLASGLNDNRHVITVNGRALPLQPTGRVGESVAGVRYRAWRSPSSLHPTIDVQAPLTFDIVDTWSQQAVGGCRYHVAHPGGRNHEFFPVNAYEAESRRLARFFRHGHTPGKVEVGPAQPSREFPFTLDLRSPA